MIDHFYHICHNTGKVISASLIIGKDNTNKQVVCTFTWLHVNLRSAMPKLGVASQVSGPVNVINNFYNAIIIVKDGQS